MTNPDASTEQPTTNPPVDIDTPDRGIVPAETGARREREGDEFKETHDPNTADPATKGYTVDQEGLANNYAIEPEMYIDEPGDLREKEENQAAERAQELKEINQDKDGQLTTEGDQRGKGQGLI